MKNSKATPSKDTGAKNNNSDNDVDYKNCNCTSSNKVNSNTSNKSYNKGTKQREGDFMDPMQYSSTVIPAFVPYGSFAFAAGIFLNDEDRNSYLSSLDSDTRSYILNHPEEFGSRQEIDDFVSQMHRS